MTKQYSPTPDEQRVISWLRGKSQRYHENAVRETQNGDDKYAEAWISGSAVLAAAASDIIEGKHHAP
jgi:hypothetical protein